MFSPDLQTSRNSNRVTIQVLFLKVQKTELNTVSVTVPLESIISSSSIQHPTSLVATHSTKQSGRQPFGPRI